MITDHSWEGVFASKTSTGHQPNEFTLFYLEVQLPSSRGSFIVHYSQAMTNRYITPENEKLVWDLLIKKVGEFVREPGLAFSGQAGSIFQVLHSVMPKKEGRNAGK